MVLWEGVEREIGSEKGQLGRAFWQRAFAHKGQYKNARFRFWRRWSHRVVGIFGEVDTRERERKQVDGGAIFSINILYLYRGGGSALFGINSVCAKTKIQLGWNLTIDVLTVGLKEAVVELGTLGLIEKIQCGRQRGARSQTPGQILGHTTIYSARSWCETTGFERGQGRLQRGCRVVRQLNA